MGIAGQDSTIVTGPVAKPRGWGRLSAAVPVRLRVWGVCALSLAVVVGGAVYWFGVRNSDSSNAASQRLWQTSLQAAEDKGDQTAIVTAATQLIDGQHRGDYPLNKSQLAHIYAQRAVAYLNLKRYQPALADYKKVSILGGSLDTAGLQGEIEAAYRVGERKQLIPLYQQLIVLKQKSDDPMRGGVILQYQQNIQTLQQGGELGAL